MFQDKILSTPNMKKKSKIQIEEVQHVEEYRPSESRTVITSTVSQYSYKVLASRDDYVALQEEVTKYLNEGWELAGGLNTSVFANQYQSSVLYTQAVYKK
jgi:hypothetical protein